MDAKELDKLWGSLADASKRRAKLLTEEHCLRAITDAYERLRELGWRDMCAADRSKSVEVIVPGHPQIAEARWYAHSENFAKLSGDWLAYGGVFGVLMNPIMYRLPAEKGR